MTRALPRLAALAGWLASTAVADLLRPADLSWSTAARFHTGDWCVVIGDPECREVLLGDRMVYAHGMERLGPVTVLREHYGAVTEDRATFVRTARELTGTDREVALARYRRAQGAWAEQTMDDIVRATEGTPADVEPAAKDSTGPVEGATVDVIDGPLPRSDGGNAWSGGTAGTYLWPKFNRDEGDT